MNVRELIQKLEELGYAGDTLEVKFINEEGNYEAISNVCVEHVVETERQKDWDPVTQPLVRKSVARNIVLLF